MKFKTLSILLLIGLCVLLSVTSTAEIEEQKPELALELLMQKNKGKVIYLDFWASWCIPCRQSFPWMNKLQEKYNTDGLVVVSINLDAEQHFATKFLNEVPAEFVIIYDNKGVLAKKFKLKGMPSSYLFDRQGEMISAHSGFNDAKKHVFEQEIIQALK